MRRTPLHEQTVVITGASSGIGRQTAAHFGHFGARVVLAARNPEALAVAAREVEDAGGTALAVPTDVSDWEQVAALADAAEREFGRIDTWVNNAGVALYGTIAQVTPITAVFAVPEDRLPAIMARVKSGAGLGVEAWDRDMKQRLADGKLLAVDSLIDTTTGTVKLKAEFALRPLDAVRLGHVTLLFVHTLDELPNDITRETMACFEPTIDYVVTKMPRFTFEKFAGAEPILSTSMKSVGEAMAIGRDRKSVV